VIPFHSSYQYMLSMELVEKLFINSKKMMWT
jgi:hypothetical protein